MGMKRLSYGWKQPKTYVIFFQMKKAVWKLLMKIWSMIQQKKLPPKLNENSSHDGLKLLVAGLWSRKQQNEAQFIWVRLANIRISCDNFSLLWKLHVQTYFFCAVFVILKSTPCLIGKERGKQNNYLHVYLILETQTSNLKEYNYSSLMQSCFGNAINGRNRSPRPFTCKSIFVFKYF